MHNRRPLRIASTIGPVETGLLPALEAAFARAQSGRVGRAATAREAAEQLAYTLVDSPTFVTARPHLSSIAKGDARLPNVLSALPVNPRTVADVSEGDAEAFIDWLLGPVAQTWIGDFGRAEHGVALFLRRDKIAVDTN